METNSTISQIITLFQVLIPIGAAARIAACAFTMAMDSDTVASLKPRIRNALIFTVLAECITGAIQLFASYYS